MVPIDKISLHDIFINNPRWPPINSSACINTVLFHVLMSVIILIEMYKRIEVRG